MRTRQRFPNVALTVAVMVLGLGLAGCVPPVPRPTSAPSATLTPVFASDEEALQVATETFQRFLDVSNLIQRELGSGPERLHSVASSEVASVEREGYERFTARGWIVTGNSKLRSVTLQSWSAQPDSVGVVASVYVCVDYSATDVVDSDGMSVVNSERKTLVPMEVAIAPTAGDASFVVTKKELLQELESCR